jgi:hypothetical protein
MLIRLQVLSMPLRSIVVSRVVAHSCIECQSIEGRQGYDVACLLFIKITPCNLLPILEYHSFFNERAILL